MTRFPARFARRFAARFVSDRSGATAIEYGLIMALLFLAIVGAVITLGGEVGTKMDETSQAIADAGA